MRQIFWFHNAEVEQCIVKPEMKASASKCKLVFMSSNVDVAIVVIISVSEGEDNSQNE